MSGRCVIPNDVLDRCSTEPINSRTVYRAHGRSIAFDNFDGHLYAAGRCHIRYEGRIGYLGFDRGMVLVEWLRNRNLDWGGLSPQEVLANLDRFRNDLENLLITQCRLWLPGVLNLEDLRQIGVDEAEYLEDHDWERGPFCSQNVGNSIRGAGFAGALLPAASRLNPALIVFPDQWPDDAILEKIGDWHPPFIRHPD